MAMHAFEVVQGGRIFWFWGRLTRGYWRGGMCIWASLQNTSGPQVGKELDDVLGHRGRSRQVVTGSLESVLIGDPVDGEGDALGGEIRIRSAGDGADILGFRSNLLLGSGFLDLGAILGFEADCRDAILSVTWQINSRWNGNLPEFVVAFAVVFTFRPNDGNWFLILLGLGSGEGHSQESESNDLMKKC